MAMYHPFLGKHARLEKGVDCYLIDRKSSPLRNGIRCRDRDESKGRGGDGLLLKEDELAWVSSAMSAVGHDLSAAGRHSEAQEPFCVALEAAVAAVLAAEAASGDKVLTGSTLCLSA